MACTSSGEDLRAVASFDDRFKALGFVSGERVESTTREDGVIVLGWWRPSETVVRWNEALYDHKIIDPDSDYLDGSNVDLVNRTIKDPSLVDCMDLPTLRHVLTFLARAERHTAGGWFESAFESGMAQAATRRLGELGAINQ